MCCGTTGFIHINSGHRCLDYWGGVGGLSNEIQGGGKLWRGERGEGKGVTVREVTHSGIKQDYGMVVRRPQLPLFQKINSEH